ncbi:hypothetical protein [Tateyamaria sp. Alg231-49]|nr:hypothetical protein [Tateyamaria sp. Alg231-49]
MPVRKNGNFKLAGQLYPVRALSDAGLEQTGQAFVFAAKACGEHQKQAA